MIAAMKRRLVRVAAFLPVPLLALVLTVWVRSYAPEDFYCRAIDGRAVLFFVNGLNSVWLEPRNAENYGARRLLESVRRAKDNANRLPVPWGRGARQQRQFFPGPLRGGHPVRLDRAPAGGGGSVVGRRPPPPPRLRESGKVPRLGTTCGAVRPLPRMRGDRGRGAIRKRRARLGVGEASAAARGEAPAVGRPIRRASRVSQSPPL